MASANGLAPCDFDEHLAAVLDLDESDWPRSTCWWRVGNTIGALSLKLNLMTELQVDQVLEAQEVEGGYFGEIAVRNEYLTRNQVNRILEIQQLHDQLHFAEQLVVAEKLDICSMVENLATFMRKRNELD